MDQHIFLLKLTSLQSVSVAIRSSMCEYRSEQTTEQSLHFQRGRIWRDILPFIIQLSLYCKNSICKKVGEALVDNNSGTVATTIPKSGSIKEFGRFCQQNCNHHYNVGAGRRLLDGFASVPRIKFTAKCQ